MVQTRVIASIAMALFLLCNTHKTGQSDKTVPIETRGKIQKASRAENNPFEIKCENHTCSVFVYKKNGKKIIVADFPGTPNTSILSSDIVSLSVSCGSPCNYTTFINLKSGRISKPFFLVLAADTLKEIVCYCDSSFLLISSIFDTTVTPLQIKRQFSPAATPFTVVDSAFFKKNYFVFRYLTGKDYRCIWDSIEVKSIKP